jgi:hypothetical protein
MWLWVALRLLSEMANRQSQMAERGLDGWLWQAFCISLDGFLTDATMSKLIMGLYMAAVERFQQPQRWL